MPKTSLEVYVLAPRWPEARAAAVSLARASRLLATEAKGRKLLSDDPTNASALKPSAAKSQDRCIAALLFKIPTVGASSGSSPGHMGPAEDGVGQAELPSKAEEEDPDSENEKLMVREPEDEDEDAADETFSFKYSPGKLRGNQYKSMMTKEELEEEQRVQREQLAAIFRLMKEKSDTFGEMSEGDMKEQLRLYDI
nr:matrix-remodeling-associated protein 7 isoform X3 [Columba livia]